MKVRTGGSGRGKSTAPTQVFWLMSLDKTLKVDPYFKYIANDSRSISHMGNMMYSLLSMRAVCLRAQGLARWDETVFPRVTLVVDNGIDIGELAEVISKTGRAVGVFLMIRPSGDE